MVNEPVGTNAGYSSGSYNGQVGLTKSVKVVPGDVISASVYAKYIDVSGPASNLANFATSLTEAFALSPGMPGEAATACQALNAFGSILATGDRDVDDENAPSGFINILVFDEGHNLVDFAFAQIDISYVQDGGRDCVLRSVTCQSDYSQGSYHTDKISPRPKGIPPIRLL